MPLELDYLFHFLNSINLHLFTYLDNIFYVMSQVPASEQKMKHKR